MGQDLTSRVEALEKYIREMEYRFVSIKRTRISGVIPDVTQVKECMFVINETDGKVFLKKRSTEGVTSIVELAGGNPGTAETHSRAHQIDDPLDHPAVPEAKRNKWLHTNAETGAIELSDLPEGLDGETPFIGMNGNWWIGEEDTGVQAAGEDGSDGDTPFIGENGNWWIGSTDTGVQAAGEDGTDGTNAYLYVAYASDDTGSDWNLTPSATLKYRAEIQSTVALTPIESDFAGATWVKYIGEDGTAGELTHYCYIAWRDAPGDGFTLTPNLTSAYEAILITHEQIAEPVEADFDGYWRARPLPAEGGGSTQLTAVPTVNKTASGITTQLNANEAQAFGDVVRINSSGKAQLAKADVIANATALAMCVSESVAADGVGNYLLIGFVRNNAWDLSVGEIVYLSLLGTTGNTLTQENPADNAGVTEDNVVQILGAATSADSIYFKPSLSQVEYK